MRQQIYIAALVLALIGWGYWSLRATNAPVVVASATASGDSSEHVFDPGHDHGKRTAASVTAPPASTTAVRAPAQATPIVPRSEMQALDYMGRTLGQIGEKSFTLKGLLEDLQRTGQEPLVVHDANPDSGEMVIVRTQSPLPGTRYFHAQYFTGDDGERFVQHMSFEFKPGPDAMSEAIAAVERNFKGLSRPLVQRADYVKWNMADHYIVWVKKMTTQDLKDDPFNAYSVSDNGTIRVAVELEIHGE